MKKLKAQDYAEIRLWMYRNARQIELALWQYYFENGSQESVLAALAMYQNADGGFGNALEADSWNTESSPYTTLYAINILNGIHFTDTGNPLMQGIFRFLESGVYSDDDGWWFNIPTNDDYPHAQWWTYDSSANKFESIGVSAGIAGFILQFSSKDTQIYQKALLVADKLIENQDLKNKVIDVIKMEITILHDYVTSHEKEWLEQGKIEGKIEGKLEGKEEEKLKIAKNMHKENYSVKEIAKITKLDCKTIEKLK